MKYSKKVLESMRESMYQVTRERNAKRFLNEIGSEMTEKQTKQAIDFLVKFQKSQDKHEIFLNEED